jgi:hypothetical protein
MMGDKRDICQVPWPCQRRFKSAQFWRDKSAQPYKYLCPFINADT